MECEFCGKECKNENSLRNHKRFCKSNPNHVESPFVKFNAYKKEHNIKVDNQFVKARKNGNEYVVSDETRAKLSLANSRRRHSDKTKEKISRSMKRAHKEGRAHNIGECRHNNEPSYPEKWFMRVIENEFPIKEYVREFPFHNYSLDFAWPELKICIEIDGEQHQRYAEYKLRDNKKDALLKSEGWKELRIAWKECFNNPKHYINLAKELFEK